MTNPVPTEDSTLEKVIWWSMIWMLYISLIIFLVLAVR
jgi:hypothetical protein